MQSHQHAAYQKPSLEGSLAGLTPPDAQSCWAGHHAPRAPTGRKSVCPHTSRVLSKALYSQQQNLETAEVPISCWVEKQTVVSFPTLHWKTLLVQLDKKLYKRHVDWKGRNICRWDGHVCRKKKTKHLLGLRIALAVQWFGLRTFTAKSLSLIPAQGTKIIPQAAAPSKDKTKQNKRTTKPKQKTLLEFMSDYGKSVGNKLKKSATSLHTSKEWADFEI